MHNQQMKVEFHDAVKSAVMTRRPLIVVEGKDDLGIYIDLVNEKPGKLNIKPIEYFKDCAAGCKEIDSSIKRINELYPPGHRVYDYLKGVVDSDAKPYRNEKIERPGLLYLNTYSFENSFVTKATIAQTIRTLTSITQEQIDNELFQETIKYVNSDLTQFYYICLEALKCAVVKDYSGLIGFADGYEKVLYDKVKLATLEKKYEDLNVFAKQYEISLSCIMEMSEFCKGKWHLNFFLKSINKFVDKLHSLCGKELSKCPLCESGLISKCLYRREVKMQPQQLVSLVKNNVANADLDYVKQVLNNMTVKIAPN